MNAIYRHLLFLPLACAALVPLACSANDASNEQDTAAATVHQATAACDRNSPFDLPQNFHIRGADGVELWGNHTSARFSADESTVYLGVISATSGWDIVKGTRISTGSYAAAEWVSELNTNRTERWASLSSDGKTMYFAQALADVDNTRIFWTTRPNTSAAWGPAKEVAGLPPGWLDTPYLHHDNELWFNYNADIYRAIVTNGDAHGTAVAVNELNQAGADDSAPVLSADGLDIYFATTRGTSPLNTDIWTARRTSSNEAFPAPHRIDDPLMALDVDDWPTWISPDNCRLYMASDRVDRRRGIWVATRRP